MKPYTLTGKVIRGEDCRRTPLYGWVSANLAAPISDAFGSVENFEDYYEFDLAHLFGGPAPYPRNELERLRSSGVELTPKVILDLPLNPVNDSDDFSGIRKGLEHHRAERGRFCYLQTNGIFECLNDVFGIENHLCYLALYPDELHEVYRRQQEWNRRFAENAIELGVDMIHVSDDWGAQNNLMFSPDMWKELIYPYHKITADAVKKAGCFLSLHSDGHILPVMEDVIGLGYDLVHPWQESAGMSYQAYLEQYGGRLAIMGGLCVQTTLGFKDYARLEQEIRRIFGLLKGSRWVFCTSHFVQEHCSLEELVFAYDLAARLARES